MSVGTLDMEAGFLDVHKDDGEEVLHLMTKSWQMNS